MAKEITNELHSRILESLTIAYVLINREQKPVLYNKIFSNYFNFDQNSKNYFLVKDIIERIEDVFKTGNESAMFINNSKNSSLKLNFSPINSKSDKVDFVVCLVIENNDKSNWQKEFNLLFEKVPCYISIVDKNFKIVRSNDKYRDSFGDNHSVFHTEMSKRRALENNIAPVAVSFNEGIEHVAYQVGQTKTGNKCHLIVNSIPLNPNLVMELATDITELNQLQEQLHQAHDFYSELIEKCQEGIIAIDDKGKVQIMNEAARKLLNLKTSRKPNINKIMNLIPEDIFKEPDINGIIINNKDIEVKKGDNEITPIRINAFEISNKKNSIGRVAYLQDMTLISQLEIEKKNSEFKAITTTFKALEKNTMQIIRGNEKDFETFEKEVFGADKNRAKNAWDVFKFKNSVTNDIIAAFIELSVGYSPEYTKIDLSNLINNSMKNFMMWAEYEKIHLEYNLIGDLTNQNTDIRMFKILITTLFNNSILSAKLNPENPEIKSKFENNGKYLAIELSDNGPYAPIDNYDNMIDLSENKNVRYGMLTLNLLVNKCGGSILSTSSLYDGNRIKVVLPLLDI